MTRPCARKRASKTCVRKTARLYTHAHLPQSRRYSYTPELLADGRRRYEQTEDRRYLDADDDKRELQIPLDDASIVEATALVSETARNIRDRSFKLGPHQTAGGQPRCPNCDFLGLCGMKDAAPYKRTKVAKR
jgi:hypothetical protein